MAGVPSVEAYLQPILECLKLHGGSMSNREMAEKVTSSMGLSEDARAMRHGRTNQTEVEYRIAWARTALSKDGLIENRRRGLWSLSGDRASTGVAFLADECGAFVELAEKSTSDGKAVDLRRKRRSDRTATPNGSSEWPEWNLPDDKEQLRLAAIAAPYIRFLHPDIVCAVVEDNERRREGWMAALQGRGVDPSLYLWQRSSCAFPGVRRYAGSSEIAQFRGRMANAALQDALALDDNSYPKAIWSFVFRGKRFQNIGPTGHALAHLTDHKAYKNRARMEFDGLEGHTSSTALYGLFTSVSNTIYMPTSLIRLTDFGVLMRNLLHRQVVKLYGGFCNHLPPQHSIRENYLSAWSLDAFAWSEPVGTTEHVPEFLDYRAAEVEKMLSNAGSDYNIDERTWESKSLLSG